MKRIFLSAICGGCFLWLATVPNVALAHGGGLDKNGCHTNRKTGEYHCHRDPKAMSQAPVAKPVQKVESANLAGKPGAPKCYTGPRGGTYTITANGKKNYKGC